MSQTLSNIVQREDRLAPTASLHVEVIADLVCPFCFIGKRHLDDALKAVQGPSEVSWYPYQINPELPADGLPFNDYLADRFGSPASIAPVLKHLADEGKAVGIDFRFDKLKHVPNTLPLHQVLHLAESRGIDQTALAEALMAAFFEQGRNIGDTDELIAIARPFGLVAEDISDAVGNDLIRQLVLGREGQVRSSGLAGAPGFLINRRLLVVGAQDADTIVNAFDRAMFGEGTDSLLSPALH